VLAENIDTSAELAVYDVVILGDSGNAYGDLDWTSFDVELEAWVGGGGGLVVTGLTLWDDPCAHSSIITGMLPVDCDASYVIGDTLSVVDAGHPVSDEIGDFTLYATVYSDTSAGLAVDATGLLQSSDGNWAVAVRDHGAGRVVFLSPAYMGKTTYGSYFTRSGETDQLLEEAVAWAGGCIDADGDLGLDSGCGGDDCDDGDEAVFWGATEACNGVDDDCDGVVPADETDDDLDGTTECEGDCDDTDATLYVEDLDGDGYSTCDGDCDDADTALNLDDLDGDGWSTCDGDCDEADPDRHPTAVEQCNGIDDDCDDVVPDDETDDDGDGLAECEGDCDDTDPAIGVEDGDGDGWSTCDGDCDDGDENVNPDAAEVPYDGVDDDCSGADLTDVDGDGYDGGDEGDDCDDGDGDVWPGADEVCDDQVDNDCDGLADDLDEDCQAGDDDTADDDDDDDDTADDDDTYETMDDDDLEPETCDCRVDGPAHLSPAGGLFVLTLLAAVRRRGA